MKAYSQKQACEFGNKNLILWQHKQTTYSDPLFKVQDPYNQLDNASCTQYTSNSTGPTQIMLFLRCNVTAQYHASQDLITQHLNPSLTLHLPTQDFKRLPNLPALHLHSSVLQGSGHYHLFSGISDERVSSLDSPVTFTIHASSGLSPLLP